MDAQKKHRLAAMSIGASFMSFIKNPPEEIDADGTSAYTGT